MRPYLVVVDELSEKSYPPMSIEIHILFFNIVLVLWTQNSAQCIKRAIRILARLKNFGRQIVIWQLILDPGKTAPAISWQTRSSMDWKQFVVKLFFQIQIFEERWDFCIGAIPWKGLWVVWECWEIGAWAIRWTNLQFRWLRLMDTVSSLHVVCKHI